MKEIEVKMMMQKDQSMVAAGRILSAPTLLPYCKYKYKYQYRKHSISTSKNVAHQYLYMYSTLRLYLQQYFFVSIRFIYRYFSSVMRVLLVYS